MTQISALPTLSVQIAFNPSNITSLTQTWTDVTPYVRAYDVGAGRQHYLDRVQSTQLRLTVNNRTGFFLNGGAAPGNATGYVLQPRCPIQITATYSGTTYNVFYGLIDSIEESVQDQVNADLTITASDFLKYLSLKYLSNSSFYPSYAKIASTQNYYRLGGSAPAVVTAAVGNGTTVTYTANNSYIAGQVVSIFGLLQSDGVTASPLNLELQTVATATPTQFTVSNGATGSNYSQNGVAYVSQYSDLVGSNLSSLHLQVAFPNNGAMAYDPQNCTDLSNGSSSPSAYATLNSNVGAAGSSYGIDFWVLGNGLNSLPGSTTTLAGNSNTGGSQIANLNVDSQGFLYLSYVDSSLSQANYYAFNGTTTTSSTSLTVGTGSKSLTVATGLSISAGDPITIAQPGLSRYMNGTATSYNSGTGALVVNVTSTLGSGTASAWTVYLGSRLQVADGYWHHVGFTIISNVLYVYYDGIFTSVATLTSPNNVFTAGYTLGGGVSTTAGTAAGLFQDACIVKSTIAQNDVKNRFRAGSLLQRGQPVTPEAVYSGDRIAETLVLAGFGTIASGTLSGLSTIYSINGSAYSTPYNSANGFINVEPYYWDSPVYNSTALDIIQQVTDTDQGAFYQRRDGTFRFNDQAFYGTWSWTPSTSTGSWAPNTYTPTGAAVWTDDDSSNYSYEPTSLQVMRDDADLWTVVKVSPQSGTEQVYDSGNETRWGYSTLSKSGTVHPSLTLALSSANYLGYLYRSPLPRVSNVELRNTSHNGGALPAILGTSLGDVVLFKRSAPNSNNATTTSTTSNTIGTGTKTFTVASGLWFVAGQTVTATSGANSMTGTVTSYSGTTLVLNITSTVGSGTFTSWTITGTYPDVQGTIAQNMVVEAITQSFQAEPGTYIATFVLDPYPVRS